MAALTLSRKRDHSFFFDGPCHSPSPLCKRVRCSSPAIAVPPFAALPPAPSVDCSSDNINKMLQLLESFDKENKTLKEQLALQHRDNAILKRAVEILDGRLKDHDERGQELEKMQQVVKEYKEKMRALEVNNYALAVHLTQAQQSCPIPERFNPHVF